MKTMTLRGEIAADGKIRLEFPCDLPPGPVDVEVTVKPSNGAVANQRPAWEDLFGLGKEIWQGIDTTQYLAALREDRELPS